MRHIAFAHRGGQGNQRRTVVNKTDVCQLCRSDGKVVAAQQRQARCLGNLHGLLRSPAQIQILLHSKVQQRLSGQLDRRHRMSVALRRRLNFETIRPIRRLQDEIDVVLHELAMLNENSGIHLVPEPAVIEVLVTMFHELRSGQSLDGRSTHRLAGAALSTAEAINVAHALSVYAFYYNEGVMRVEDLVHFIIGAALKDKPDDRRRLKYYFENEISQKQGKAWQAIYQQRDLL